MNKKLLIGSITGISTIALLTVGDLRIDRGSDEQLKNTAINIGKEIKEYK